MNIWCFDSSRFVVKVITILVYINDYDLSQPIARGHISRNVTGMYLHMYAISLIEQHLIV